MAASYAISVRQASGLPAASFRSHLTVNTLAVRLTVPPAGSVGDLHPQVSAPCRAHNQVRLLIDQPEHVIASCGNKDLVAFVLEMPTDERDYTWLVISNEDHSAYLPSPPHASTHASYMPG